MVLNFKKRKKLRKQRKCSRKVRWGYFFVFKKSKRLLKDIEMYNNNSGSNKKAAFKFLYSGWFSWTLVIFWMLVIFFFSAQPAQDSNKLSRGAADFIIRVIGRIKDLDLEVSTGAYWYDRLNGTIRSLAHSAVYFILAVLTSSAVSKRRLPMWKNLGISMLICVLFAVSDEIHQMFVPGRTAEVKDLLLDSAGASLGLIFMVSKKYISASRRY